MAVWSWENYPASLSFKKGGRDRSSCLGQGRLWKLEKLKLPSERLIIKSGHKYQVREISRVTSKTEEFPSHVAYLDSDCGLSLPEGRQKPEQPERHRKEKQRDW